MQVINKLAQEEIWDKVLRRKKTRKIKVSNKISSTRQEKEKNWEQTTAVIITAEQDKNISYA